MHIKYPYTLFYYYKVKARVPKNIEYNRLDLHYLYNISRVSLLSIIIIKIQPSLDTT